METKEVKISVPKGYEIDKENSTFECIKFKKIDDIKTWDDFKRVTKNDLKIDIDTMYDTPFFYTPAFTGSEKISKALIAMIKIWKLMPYYGGVITDEEWIDEDSYKYIIGRYNNDITTGFVDRGYEFLAFHTEQQEIDFLKYNERLVKDYLMLE